MLTDDELRKLLDEAEARGKREGLSFAAGQMKAGAILLRGQGATEKLVPIAGVIAMLDEVADALVAIATEATP